MPLSSKIASYFSYRSKSAVCACMTAAPANNAPHRLHYSYFFGFQKNLTFSRNRNISISYTLLLLEVSHADPTPAPFSRKPAQHSRKIPFRAQKNLHPQFQHHYTDKSAYHVGILSYFCKQYCIHTGKIPAEPQRRGLFIGHYGHRLSGRPFCFGKFAVLFRMQKNHGLRTRQLHSFPCTVFCL